MTKGVVGDFVALSVHLLEHLVSGLSHLPDDEEGCFDVFFFEEFEEIVGDFSVGSVVECEGEFGSV